MHHEQANVTTESGRQVSTPIRNLHTAYSSPTPMVVGEGFLSQKRPALCKATRANNSIVRIKLSNTIQFLYNINVITSLYLCSLLCDAEHTSEGVR